MAAVPRYTVNMAPGPAAAVTLTNRAGPFPCNVRKIDSSRQHLIDRLENALQIRLKGLKSPLIPIHKTEKNTYDFKDNNFWTMIHVGRCAILSS